MKIKVRRFSLYVLTAFAFLAVLFSVCMPFASADVVQTTVSKYFFSSPVAWKETSSGVSYSLLTPFQLVLDNSVRPGGVNKPSNQLSLQFQDYNTMHPSLPGGHTIPFPTGGIGSPPSTVESSLLATSASCSSSPGVIPSPGPSAGIAGKWTLPETLVITSPFSASVNFTSWSASADSSVGSFTGLSLSGEGVLTAFWGGGFQTIIYQSGSWVGSFESIARYPDFGLEYQKNLPAAFWTFFDANATFCPVPYNQSSDGSEMEAVSVPVTINFSGYYGPDFGGVTSVQITPPAVDSTATVIVDFKIFFENQSSADPLQVTFSVPSSTIIASPFGSDGLTYNFNVSESYNNGYNIGYYEGQQALKPQLEAQYNQGYSDGREYQASLGDNSFFDLITAVVDAPVLYFTKLLDFELLGFNMQSFVGAFLVIGLLIAVLRFVL